MKNELKGRVGGGVVEGGGGGQTPVNILSGGINMQRRKAEEINEEAVKEEHKKNVREGK